MKKILSLTMVLAMLGTVLTGCGSKDATAKTPAESTQQTAPVQQEQSQTEKALALINTFHLSPMRVSVVSTGQAGSSFFAFASIISIPPKIFSSAKLPKNLTTAQSFLSGNYPLVSIW